MVAVRPVPRVWHHRGVQRNVRSTVVALVGADASEATSELGSAANVRAVVPDRDEPDLDRAVVAWRAARTSASTFVAHDADPLATVVDAWVALFDGRGARGDLEVAVAETLARWRAGSLELPDYYLVLEPDDLDTTRSHWFLGVLHERAPARVVPVAGTPDALRGALAQLRASRWWPEMDELLDGIERVVPDRAGLRDHDIDEDDRELV